MPAGSSCWAPRGTPLAVAAELGADHVLAAPADPVASVLELTDGRGADLVVDLAPGVTTTTVDAIGMAGRRARVVFAASKHGRGRAGRYPRQRGAEPTTK